MDWKHLDSARRDAGAIEVDLIEAYAQGKINRRNFVKRGTIVGLSMPFMGGIIAACGGDDDEASTEGTAAPEGTADIGEAGTDSSAAQGGTVTFANQQGDANSGLDPVNMLDLGTYNVLSQSMEFLVGLGDDGNIAATALALDWSPNDTGDEWTFNLRPNVKWQDGSDFTSADVAATMDRLVAKQNAALAGVIGEGAVDASDPLVAKFTLIEPNGNFPVLVSIFNSQAVIAPADYVDGTTLNERPAGTGAWILDDFDVATFTATFVRNENWWGGTTPLDGHTLRGFADIGTAVTAMSSREVDGIQQFSVIGGEGLLNDSNFTVLSPPAANHRQAWFNVAEGQFAGDEAKLIRQAFAWCWDRDQMVSTLFNGQGRVANDHPILDSLPFYDPNAVEQRTRDIEMARSLLAEAGVDSVTATIESGDLQEIPQLAEIMKQNAAEAGIELSVNVQSNSTFYGDSWCPSDESSPLPCPGSADFGIVDYGHRPIPDVFLGSALATGGVWNSSNWSNEEFDQNLSDYRTAVDVEGQTAAIGNIQRIVWEEVPASYPYFFDYLGGHDASVNNVTITALGQAIMSAATKDA